MDKAKELNFYLTVVIIALVCIAIVFNQKIVEQAEIINQSTIWIDQTDSKIQELQARADSMQTTCTQYLNEVTYGRPN